MALGKRWLMLLPVLLFLNLTIFLTPDNAFNEDLGRHLKLGQIISQTHQVPKTNLLSHTMPHQRFINHHWLSQVIFWQTYQTGGLVGLMVLRLFLLNAIFFCLYLVCQQKLKRNIWLLSPFFVLSILLFRNRFDLRPELFTYLLTVSFIFLLTQKLTKKKVVLLTVLQLLWANLHIFFFLGPFLVATSLMRRVRPFKGTDPNLMRALLTLSLLLAVNLVNPNGLVGALFPLLILRGYGYSVVENQSIFYLKRYFPQVNFSLYYLALLITTGSLVVSAYRKRTAHLLWQVMALVLSLKMIRNFPFLLLLTLSPLASNLNYLAHQSPLKKQWVNLTLGTTFTAVVLAIAGLVFLPTKPTNWQFKMSYDRLGKFLKTHPLPDHIFNNYDIGSFLIWKLYPEHQVFVDNRPEAYSKAFFEETYKPMQMDLATFQNYADQYNIQTIIWSKTDMTPWSNHFLNKIIPQLNTWQVAYEDAVSLVLIKN